ncbi:NUDIX hydrolase [Thiopseudomonas denitrificans]|uniref:GDP-mannose pyrophosphatase n=1 Tax=Thiopseudomonas denitrificans TaxID=1501432 RepID=A0A4R6TXI7_9GAMM|nr:NUDIX hydrolase [Thiopseudomonas denitrificans]TDQ38600.1 ADP-ribose pyrophosphatase [Thiopseudomonas denitrificans]
MNLTETRVNSATRFTGNIINVRVDQVRLPDGRLADRECVQHPGGAAVLAVTPQQQVILVRQHRYVCGRDMLELPAGKLDAGEEPAGCALRELAEETPYTAGSVQLVHAFYSTPGFCNEKIYLFWAQDVEANSQAVPDDGELLELVLLDAQQVREALAQQRIEDGKTLVALYWWLAGGAGGGTLPA